MDLFKSSKFDSQVEDLMQQWHVPGIAIALVQDKEVASKGFGKAHQDPPMLCTPDTIFDIASSSKSLTAAAVALLVEDDEKYSAVQWDARMCELLPDDFVMSEESYTWDVRVEDILSHRTGLPSHDYSYIGPNARHPDDAKSVTRNLRNLPISAPIRSKFQYCNLMLTVATHLVETITGSKFADFLLERFFKPLGMTSTHLQPEAAIAAGLKDRIASGHMWEEDKSRYKPLPLVHQPEAQGAGAIFTSVNDHIKWVKALMNQEGPVTEGVYDSMTKARTIVDPESKASEDVRWPRTSSVTYAAGLEVRYYRGHQVVQHDGLNYGFGSVHFFVPEIKFGGVLLGNSNNATDLCPIISRILIDEALEIPEKKRPAWNAMAKGTDRRQDADAVEEKANLRRELLGGLEEPQPQEKPLSEYTGRYSNAGYHELEVLVKDGKLSADGSDRSMGYYLTFEHIRDQTEYIVHFDDFLEDGDQHMAGRFEFEDGEVTRMGVKLEEDYNDFIWFDKVEELPLR